MRNRLIVMLLAGTLAAGPVQAQKLSVETRLETLEKQVKALQRRVFQTDGTTLEPEIGTPQGPSTTSGIPASGPDYLGRINTIETQLAEITNRLEQAEYKIGQLETGLSSANSKIAALEKRVAAIEAADKAAPETVATAPKPTPMPGTKPAADPDRAAKVAAVKKQSTGNAGEDAYMYGHDLWAAKLYPEARTQLKTVLTKYPKHRRASYAQNLIGRAWMDEGNYTEASQAFFDSYKKFPEGERAGDSLYFLGQSLVKLNEPARACEAYKEFDAMYAATATGDLKSKVVAGKRDAKCK